MKALSAYIVGLAIIAASCSKSSSPTPVPSTNAAVHWFRNQQGLISSDVKTNGFPSLSSPDGKEVAVHLDGDNELHDPLEDAPEFAAAFRDADAQADAYTQQWSNQLGRVHLFWKRKKEVLREKYQIDWKSPYDLNPMTMYD